MTLGKSVVLPRFIYNNHKAVRKNRRRIFVQLLHGFISLRRLAAVSYYLTRLLFVAEL